MRRVSLVPYDDAHGVNPVLLVSMLSGFCWVAVRLFLCSKQMCRKINRVKLTSFVRFDVHTLELWIEQCY